MAEPESTARPTPSRRGLEDLETASASPPPPPPPAFESPVERQLLLDGLNAKLFGDRPRAAQALVIGRFTLQRKLGQGSMGTVYLGYDEELGRRAAIKVLRGRPDDDGEPEPGAEQGADVGAGQARERMLREAKALARLSHPNVVPIYESGRHEDDLFIAMEFIEGETLGEWLGETRSREAILDVFMAAGRGLAAAHAAKLVHRDFKPANVMIAKEGQVKVLDFGLARRSGRRTESMDSTGKVRSWLSVDLTQTGAIMGTPAYMAPEQHRGESSEARGDQFSFCVSLWEALYGQRPFSGDTFIELTQNVLGGRLREPPRGADVPSWQRAVLERGLAPEQEDRFASMDALLDALGQRPRQRWRVALAAVAAVTFVAGVGWGAARWFEPEPAAEVCADMGLELAESWSEARRASVGEALSGTGLSYAQETGERVELGLDRYAADWVAARREACEATARGAQSGGLLDRRMACLDDHLREFEALVELLSGADEALVRRAVAAVESLPELERCADRRLLDEQDLPTDPRVMAELDELRWGLAEGQALYRAGDYERAEGVLESTAARAEPLDYAPFAAKVALLRGRVAVKLAHNDSAEAQLMAAYSGALGAGMLDTAARSALALISLHADGKGDPKAAQDWVVHTQSLVQASDSAELEAALAGNLASLARTEGRYDDARASLSRQLELLEELGAGGLHLSISNTNMGIVLAKQSEFEEAKVHFAAALEIEERLLGPHHPQVAAKLDNLGNVVRNLGDVEGALDDYARSLAIREQALGVDHPEVAATLSNMGVAHLEGGHPERARPLQERACDIYRAGLGPEHPRLAVALSNLGMTLSELKEYDEALASYAEALVIKRAAYGEEHPSVIYSIAGLGSVYELMGDYESAREHFERARDLTREKLGAEHVLFAFSLSRLGSVEQAEGDPRKAYEYALQALLVAEPALGPEHPQLAHILMGLGSARMGQGRAADALPYFERALSVREGVLEADSVELGNARVYRGAARLCLGEVAEALDEVEGVLRQGPSNLVLLAAARRVRLEALRRTDRGSVRARESEDELDTTLAELDESDRLAYGIFEAWFEAGLRSG